MRAATKEIREKITALHAEGLTQREIGRRLFRCGMAIRYHAKALGLEFRRGRPRRYEHHLVAWLELRRKGHSLRGIAQAYGVSRTAVTDVLRRFDEAGD